MKVVFTLLFGGISGASAAITSFDPFFVGKTIPDNNAVGLADTRVVSTWIDTVQLLRVSLEISGGWNGDYYAHLVHDTGFAVLLNRVGRGESMAFGSPGEGMSVTFDDTAPLDIHLAAGPGYDPLIGNFQPSARTADPAAADTDSPRSAFLSSFVGLDPNGEWTLFIADVGAGESGVLVSWSLEIQGIPEPSSAMLAIASLLAGCAMRRRLPRPASRN